MQGFRRVGLLLCPPSKLDELRSRLLGMEDHKQQLSNIKTWSEADFDYARRVLTYLEDDSEDAKELATIFLKSGSWDLCCEPFHMRRTPILKSIKFMSPEYWSELVGTFSWSQVKKT